MLEMKMMLMMKRCKDCLCRMEEGSLTDALGRKLHTYTWANEGEARGLLFLCHGWVGGIPG